MSPQPIVIPKFLDEAECKLYTDYLRQSKAWESATLAFWNERTINLKSHDEVWRERLLDLRVRTVARLRAAFDLLGPVYSDVFPCVRWMPGYELHPHADSRNPDGSPHPFHYRQWTSILYLNHDYEGGQLYFPTRDLEPVLDPGTLLLFVGDLDNLHGVKEVSSGTRYTISGFYTQDERYHDGYRL